MICGHCQREIADYANYCYFCGALQRTQASGRPRAVKRLMRSSADSKIAGVCGGVAEYLEIDSTLVRLAFVLLFLTPLPVVPALIAYIAAWLVVPRAPLPTPAAKAPSAAPHSAPMV